MKEDKNEASPTVANLTVSYDTNRRLMIWLKERDLKKTPVVEKLLEIFFSDEKLQDQVLEAK